MRHWNARSRVVRVLVELISALNNIDHNILLNRLRQRCDIQTHALYWIDSYKFANRKRHVVIGQAFHMSTIWIDPGAYTFKCLIL